MSAEFPAADRPRLHVHEHRQGDEVVLEAHVRNIGHPNRIGLPEREIDDKIGIARIGMVTVGRATASHWRMADEPQFAHETADSLSIDRSRAFAAQLCADAAIAVGWPLPSDSLDMRPHLLLLRVCGGHPAEPLVRIDATAWQVKRCADHCQRIRRGGPPAPGGPPLPTPPPASYTTFFFSFTPHPPNPAKPPHPPTPR